MSKQSICHLAKCRTHFCLVSLIMQATDINNVGSIFHGWQPYL